MSWSLNASGHVGTAEEESEVIARLREMVQRVQAVSAGVSTQYHGYVNLLDNTSFDTDENDVPVSGPGLGGAPLE